MGQEFGKDSAGLLSSDPHASPGVAGAGGPPSQVASSPTHWEPLSKWLLTHLGPFSWLRILPAWWSQGIHPSDMVSGFQRPRQKLPVLPEEERPCHPAVSQSSHRAVRFQRGGGDSLYLSVAGTSHCHMSCLRVWPERAQAIGGFGETGMMQATELQPPAGSGKLRGHNQQWFFQPSIHDPTSCLLAAAPWGHLTSSALSSCGSGRG